VRRVQGGTGNAHHLVNRTERDAVTYPDDDILAAKGSGGQWRYVRKSGMLH
jgi:hypothetical protein